MYLERLPGLQARIFAYQEKTKGLEITWREPIPVPTIQRSRLYDYFFSWGRFIMEDDSESGLTLACFARNPNRKVDFSKPHEFMLVWAPIGTLEDILVIFNTHINDHDMGTVADEIRIIKGVVPELPFMEDEALEFNFKLNKEISILFFLAAQAAQTRNLMNTKVELDRLSSLKFEREDNAA